MSDTPTVGGKGASLGEMMRMGISVPDGFVICSGVFENFLKQKKIDVKIKEILKNVDAEKIETINDASEKIRNLIVSSTIPEDIAGKIMASYRELGSEFVAVRSSATAEDSLTSAWAGQLESYLNTTKKDILEKVKKCWASLFTPRAISYRIEQNLENKKILVAVIVQKMVNAEKAGVAFSINPVTGNQEEIIIEAGFGLGESVVSGAITPDRYVVGKEDRAAREIKVSEKEKGLYQKTIGGNEWKKLKNNKRKERVLTNKEITQLASIIKEVEQHYGFACDIEWAKEKRGNYYIVQNRPITTIQKGGQTQEYRKIMTRPLSLVECECWDIGERVKMPQQFKNLLYFDPLFIYGPKKGVAVYYNFTDPDQSPQPLIAYLEKNNVWFENKKKEFDKHCQEIRTLLKKNSLDYKRIVQLNHAIWSTIAVANVLANTEVFKVSDRLRKLCVKIREESDDILHPSLTQINIAVKKKLGLKDIQNVSLHEALATRIPNISEMNKRKKGWLYHKGKIVYDAERYLQKNYIQLIAPTKKQKNSISGNAACRGFVKGKARLVFELSELKKIKKGDILVTPMTTPDMIPVLKHVSAIITDEGGIICHAAIVSRELQIPCIIGTTNATQIIKDGDLLEVDASNGKIKILKESNKIEKNNKRYE